MSKKKPRSSTQPNKIRSRTTWSRRPKARTSKLTKPKKRDHAVSPSQVAQFLECERAWAYDKIDRIPRKPNKYAQIGTAMHKELERWIAKGRPPNSTTLAGRMALAGLHNLPEPRIAKVEKYVRFIYKGVTYHGYVDAHWVHNELPLLFVHDHKSTGDFRWAKTPETLLDDPQMAIYSFGLLLAHPEYEEVVGRWQYHKRRPDRNKSGYKHRTRLVQLRRTREEVEEHMERVHQVGLRIAQARSEPASARPKNFSNCGNYGGCDYKEICHRGVGPLDKLRGIMARSKAIEMLKKRKAERGEEELRVIDVDAVREAKKPPAVKSTKKKSTKKKPTKRRVEKSAPKKRIKKKKIVWKAARVGMREKSGDTLIRVKLTDGSVALARLEGVSVQDVVRD